MRVNDPNEAHSGRLLVRMPRELHDRLSRFAHEQGVPLNTAVVHLLSSGSGWRSETEKGSPAPSSA